MSGTKKRAPIEFPEFGEKQQQQAEIPLSNIPVRPEEDLKNLDQKVKPFE